MPQKSEHRSSTICAVVKRPDHHCDGHTSQESYLQYRTEQLSFCLLSVYRSCRNRSPWHYPSFRTHPNDGRGCYHTSFSAPKQNKIVSKFRTSWTKQTNCSNTSVETHVAIERYRNPFKNTRFLINMLSIFHAKNHSEYA